MRRPGMVGWSNSASGPVGVMQAMRLFTALCLVLAAFAGVAAAPSAAGFRFQDMEGRTVQLDNFRGKWVVVNFWAHWCPLCWPEVSELNALNARKDVTVIGVAMDYGPDELAVQTAIKRQGMRYKAQVLGGNRVSTDAAYHQVGPVGFYPTSYIFDPKGVRHARINGPLSAERFQSVIQGGL